MFHITQVICFLPATEMYLFHKLFYDNLDFAYFVIAFIQNFVFYIEILNWVRFSFRCKERPQNWLKNAKIRFRLGGFAPLDPSEGRCPFTPPGPHPGQGGEDANTVSGFPGLAGLQLQR